MGSVEHYEMYYKAVLIGYLDINEAGQHRYTVCRNGVQAVRDTAPLMRLLEQGTDGYVEPIPFFYTRICHMEQWHLTEINYQTDWFLLRKIG